MFVTGEPAWHRLGTVIERATTSAEAIGLAGLDWRVEQWPVRAFDPDHTATEAGIPDTVANVRTDTKAVLGVVGRRYRVFQNREAFDFMDALVGDKLAMYETAGSLHGGRRVWMMARIPAEYRAGPDDLIQPYVLLTNTHDGTQALRMIPTTVRVVCQNTLNLALRGAGTDGLSVSHHPRLESRIAEARAKLGIIAARFDAFDDELHAMLAKDLTVTEAGHYFRGISGAGLPATSERQKNGRQKVLGQRWSAWGRPRAGRRRSTPGLPKCSPPSRPNVRWRLMPRSPLARRSMGEAPHGYYEATTAELRKLAARRDRLEAKYADLDDDIDPDGERADALNAKAEALDETERALTAAAPVVHAEATKAAGTAFLILDPDGRVRREYRAPRPRHGAATTPAGSSYPADGSGPATPQPPTSDDLHDGQRATTFTHQALGVRRALLADAGARRRVLAMALHDHVRSEALAVRHDPNGATLHADHADGFASAARDELRKRRTELDPFHDRPFVNDVDAYATLATVPDAQVDALIDLLTVECITAHLQRRTELVARLAAELGVNVRRDWRPDAEWLAGYKKAQLVHLTYALRGPAYGPAAERKKKSEVVAELADQFAAAAEGRLEDARLAATLNAWLPSNLRERPIEPAVPEAHREAA